VRRIFAIIVAKIAIALARLLGHGGSNIGGELALRICPDILAWFASQVKEKIILVTGTNGKTSTNNMIYSIIRQSGHTCVCNKLGANLDSGLISAFISDCSLTGRIDADYATLEVDEASLAKVIAQLEPDIIVFTNLFRDQLDRYNEIDEILDKIKASLQKAQNAVLLINADEPSLVSLGYSVAHAKYYYGIETRVDMGSLDLAKDNVFCKFCGARLDYVHYFYGQLGHYSCTKCRFKRPDPDFKAHIQDFEHKRELTVIGSHDFKVIRDFNTNDTYSIYNTLAAVSVGSLLGNTAETVEKGLENYRPQVGRMERFFIGKPITLNLAKNPVGFNESMKMVRQDARWKVVAIGINDMPQDGRDVSWLWDTNFEILLEMDDTTVNYVVFGRRRYDMALRLKYAGIDEGKLTISETIEDAIDEAVGAQSDVAYILLNYSLLFETQKILKERNEGAETNSVPSVS